MDLQLGLGLLLQEFKEKKTTSRNRRRGGKVEKLRISLFVRELEEKVVRKTGAGERAIGGRKAGAGRIGRVVHRMHSGSTKGK